VTGAILITLALRAVQLPLLLRLALDAEQVGTARIHLPDDLAEPAEAVAALRAQTGLILSANNGGPLATLVDLTSDSGVLRRPDGPPVLTEVVPGAAVEPARYVADLASLIGVCEPPVSVVCQGESAVVALLTALAAGAHARVGTAGTPPTDNPREDVQLAARAAGIARLIGRPAMPVAQARALLGLG
jgi:hypothetical protein